MLVKPHHIDTLDRAGGAEADAGLDSNFDDSQIGDEFWSKVQSGEWSSLAFKVNEGQTFENALAVWLSNQDEAHNFSQNFISTRHNKLMIDMKMENLEALSDLEYLYYDACEEAATANHRTQLTARINFVKYWHSSPETLHQLTITEIKAFARKLQQMYVQLQQVATLINNAINTGQLDANSHHLNVVRYSAASLEATLGAYAQLTEAQQDFEVDLADLAGTLSMQRDPLQEYLTHRAEQGATLQLEQESMKMEVDEEPSPEQSFSSPKQTILEARTMTDEEEAELARMIQESFEQDEAEAVIAAATEKAVADMTDALIGLSVGSDFAEAMKMMDSLSFENKVQVLKDHADVVVGAPSSQG